MKYLDKIRKKGNLSYTPINNIAKHQMKNKLVFLCILFPVSLFGQEIDNTEPKLYDPNELILDFNELFRNLEEIHPNLYFYVSKDIIDSLRLEAEKKFSQPMTALGFWKVAAPIVVRVKDGHTALPFPWGEWKQFMENGGKLFPFEVKADSLSLVVTKNNSTDSLIVPQTEILAINGIPVLDILNKMRQYHNGERLSFVNLKTSRYFKFYLWALFGFDGIFDVEFKNPSGEVYSKSVDGIDKVQYDLIRKQRKPRKPDYSFYKTSYANIGVIDFRRMNNNGEFRKFTDSVFTVIENDNISALIIDVRKNGGGNSQLVDVLLSHFNTKPYTQAERMDLKVSSQSRKAFRKRYFKWYIYPLYPVTLFYKRSRQLLFGKKGKLVSITNEPEAHKVSEPFFKGPVYLLTSPNTFSSANILADVFKCYEMGTIIGEETGGLTIAFGDLIFYTLENTGLRGNCSFKQFFHPCGKADNHGVIPDIEVIQKPKDTEKGIDTVLEYTIDYIIGMEEN